MLIGLISDTHDRLPMIDRAIDLFQRRGVQAVIHPGDLVAPFAAERLLRYAGPIYVIYGNNDGEREGLKKLLPQITDGPVRLVMAGKKVLVHHFIDWCKPNDIAQADIVITGHTHGVVDEQQNGTLFLNPGECCGWVNGRCTVALLDTETMRSETVDLAD